jgi:hypothetical protein
MAVENAIGLYQRGCRVERSQAIRDWAQLKGCVASSDSANSFGRRASKQLAEFCEPRLQQIRGTTRAAASPPLPRLVLKPAFPKPNPDCTLRAQRRHGRRHIIVLKAVLRRPNARPIIKIIHRRAKQLQQLPGSTTATAVVVLQYSKQLHIAELPKARVPFEQQLQQHILIQGESAAVAASTRTYLLRPSTSSTAALLQSTAADL